MKGYTLHVAVVDTDNEYIAEHFERVVVNMRRMTSEERERLRTLEVGKSVFLGRIDGAIATIVRKS